MPEGPSIPILCELGHAFVGQVIQQNVLRAHWLAHNQKICPRCLIPFRREQLRKTHRRSFYCENCQRRYVDA